MNFSIGEFSKVTKLSASTLRYYEQEQLIVANRDSAGWRYYTEQDVEWILFIKKLKETGMLIKEIREYAVLRYKGDSTMQRRLEILEQHKVQVIHEKEKWDSNLQRLEEKNHGISSAAKQVELLITGRTVSIWNKSSSIQ